MVYRKFIKPMGDILLSIFGLLILFPLFATLFIVVFIHHNGHAFFLQERAGKHGKPFTIIKFKTMNNQKDAMGKLLPNNQRMGVLGKFLRKYSLDEIPQLINILKGEMSLVGPRPLHTKYLSRYDEVQARRHEVLGGITGWAQINGRNAIGWEQKFNYDIWYIENQSLWLDLKIIWLTLLKVLLKENINNSREVSMPTFTKSKKKS